MAGQAISSIMPFFIVRDVPAALAFYRDRLGFAITYQGPPGDIFFGMASRDGASIMFKALGEPVPNFKRRPAMSWDAYLDVPDPDALAAELSSRGVTFAEPLQDRDDG